MACTCQYGGICSVHPRCPWCKNYSTVFASGQKEFRCTRCKKVFTKKTEVNVSTCTTLDHIYPAAKPGQTMRKCYCGKRTIKVTKFDNPPSISTAHEGDTTMAKKNQKKSTKSETTRESNLHYSFVRSPKEEVSDETIMGCVLAGIKRIKSGSLDDATSATLKAGFAKVSDQDAREKTRIMLRRLANDGIVKVTRNGAEVGARKAKKSAKGKGFKLVGNKKR